MLPHNFANMAQKKLYRFAQIKQFENVFEYPEDMRGKWSDHFKNKHPLYVELGCGRGEYTLALSKLYPDRNFIGVDIKGNRMFIGAKTAREENRKNVAFLRTQIEMLPQYFHQDEVEEIWLTFPDPQLRNSKAKKRLTHPRFLRLYQQVLKRGGAIHLKTDSPPLFEFTKLVIELYSLPLLQESRDIYAESATAELSIKTHYEALDIAQSKSIHYLKFSLPEELPDSDQLLKEFITNEK